jgi:hypothetical protein
MQRCTDTAGKADGIVDMNGHGSDKDALLGQTDKSKNFLEFALMEWRWLSFSCMDKEG